MTRLGAIVDLFEAMDADEKKWAFHYLLQRYPLTPRRVEVASDTTDTPPLVRTN